jgi:glycosyltransferase involved in cell wall biosynthesis
VRVGILVCAYNAERFLSHALASIQAQTYADWRCLVVDDGSTDGTAALVDALAVGDTRFSVLRAAHEGVARARDKGLARLEASCSGVVFLDSDDVWCPHALSTLYGALAAHPEWVGVHGLADYIDSAGQPQAPGEFAAAGRRRIGLFAGRMVPWPLEAPTCLESVLYSNTVYPPGVMLVRQDAYRHAGPFATHACEDWDMIIRLARQGCIGFVPEVVLGYRRHATNSTNDAPRFFRAVRQVHYDHAYDPHGTPGQRRAARRGWRAYQTFKLAERLEEAHQAWRERQLRRVAYLLLAAGLHGLRWLWGRPTRRGI